MGAVQVQRTFLDKWYAQGTLWAIGGLIWGVQGPMLGRFEPFCYPRIPLGVQHRPQIMVWRYLGLPGSSCISQGTFLQCNPSRLVVSTPWSWSWSGLSTRVLASTLPNAPVCHLKTGPRVWFSGQAPTNSFALRAPALAVVGQNEKKIAF